MSRERRRKHLIRPRIQLAFALFFATSAGVAVLLYGLLLQAGMVEVASAAEWAAIDRAMVRAAIVVGLLLAPLSVSMAIISTHRIVGPLYRFDRFLRDVLAGREQRPCGIRRHDELRELCTLLNEVTAEQRERNGRRDEQAAAARSELDGVPSLVAQRQADPAA